MRPVAHCIGVIAVVTCMVTASQTVAQPSAANDSPEPYKSISAEQLKNRCLLIAGFDEDTPDSYEAVALAGGWTDVLEAFGDRAFFQVLCLGDQHHRGAVFIRDAGGRFQATSPSYPPYWHIADNGMFCFGLAGDPDRSCAGAHIHDASGTVRFGDPPTIFVVLKNSEGAPIFEDVHLVLGAILPAAQ